jgi:hypothetical protein
MKYRVGTSQKIALYTARFSSNWGILLCIKNIQNTENGIPSHNIRPKFLGACVPNDLLVEELWNILSLYSTAFNLDTKYGVKITAPSACTKPNGTTSSSNWKINIIKLGSAKNIRFQKLSLLSLEAIKPVCSVATLCISRALAALCDSANSVKSSISTFLYYGIKTYDLSIANLKWFLKLIMQLLISFSLCLPISNTMATPVNNRDRMGIRGMIAKAEVEYQIPSGLLSAIAKVESDIKEFAVNVGGKATYANSLAEAVSVVNTQINAGKQNIDLGVMQLNYRWHGSQFKSLEEMLTPKKNIAYAASLLSSLYKQHDNWQMAIRHYHSANPKYSSKYSRKVTMAWLSN